MNAELKKIIETTDFERLFKDKGFAFFTKGVYNLNIIGIRWLSGPEYDPLKKTLVQTNKFNDAIVLIYREVENGPLVKKIYAATTDPGIKYLVSPMSSVATLGTAVLVHDKQYKYQLGKHKGYDALVQKEPVTVWRDNTRDNIINLFGKEYTGFFSINIHGSRGAAEAVTQDPSKVSETIYSDVVDGWSAGCNVVKYAKQFSELISICRKAKETWGNSFTYTLITSLDLKDY